MKLGWNIITTSKPVEEVITMKCQFHQGTRLIELKDKNQWACPECGLPATEEQLTDFKARLKGKESSKLIDEEKGVLKAKISQVNSGPKVIQPKRRKQKKDLLGNKVPDDMIAGLTTGQTIDRYEEYSEGDSNKSSYAVYK